MAVEMTQEEFARHLNTKFRVVADTPEPVELELVEAQLYRPEPHEEGGMERFSAVFSGPPNYLLSQGVYPLTHEHMGDLTLFLVPIKVGDRLLYEAVFNYYKKSDE
jgi:CRISPR/Cas system-associated protein Cas5 (RAMP superfamily)